MSMNGTTQEKAIAAAQEALRRIGGSMFKPSQIKFEGNEFRLPGGTTHDEAIRFIQADKVEMFQESDFSRTYKYRPHDGAYAAVKFFKETFGAMVQRSSFFMNAQQIDIEVAYNEHEAIPWGSFTIPVLPEVVFSFGAERDDELGMLFVLRASGPKFRGGEIYGVFDGVERELRQSSIYKGKAFDGGENPKFIDLSSTDESRLVYSDEVMKALSGDVFFPMRHTDLMRDRGERIKSAALLHGRFGVGKTEALRLAAKKATENGWTAILVEPGKHSLREAIVTARMYGPAIVLSEDLDNVASAEEEAAEISRVLDLFDGVTAKNQEVKIVITSNYIDKLHAGMLRPGRIDSIIEIGAPDAAGIEKMIKLNTSDLGNTIEWEQVTDAMEGFYPSFVVETGAKAWRYMADRLDGEVENAKLATEDLVAAARNMRKQFELHENAKTEPTKVELVEAMKSVVATAIEAKLDERLLKTNEEAQIV